MSRIEFIVRSELAEVIPPPVPAARLTPEWYRKLEARIPAASQTEFPGESIKACMPVLDAYHAGFIITSAAPVRFVVDGDSIHTTWRSPDLPMVESHSEAQVAGSGWPGPFLKWINYWRIKTPPGYSSLITAPVNRPELPFQALTGVVDTDTYPTPVNFPGLWTGPRSFDEVIPAGTPIAQVIPFKRETWTSEHRAATETESDEAHAASWHIRIRDGAYRDLWRRTKVWRRRVDS